MMLPPAGAPAERARRPAAGTGGSMTTPMGDPAGLRPRYAGTPITDDDATIAAMLEDVSIPTLLLSLVHLTGDASILQGPLRPQGIYLNEVQGFMSPEDQAAVRALALEAIIAYRDGG